MLAKKSVGVIGTMVQAVEASTKPKEDAAELQKMTKPSPKTPWESLLQHERGWIVSMQSQLGFPWFCTFMHILGETCTGDGLVVFFAILNWCVDNRWGTEAIWLIPISEILNGLIKWTFRHPRPTWVDKSVRQFGHSAAHELSFPSSHAMLTFSLAVYFAHELRSPLPYVYAAMVCFSRVFEGMHYPHDVSVGALIGVGLGAGLLYTLEVVQDMRLFEYSALMRTWLGLMFSFVLLALVFLEFAKIRKFEVPAEWLENATKWLGPGKKLEPAEVPLRLYVGMCGVVGGLAVGESNYMAFAMPTEVLHSISRVVVGLAILLSIFLSIRALDKVIQPYSRLGALSLCYLRFASVPPIILIIAPAAFRFFGI